MINTDSSEIIAITYVGSGRFNFYNDCSQNASRLKRSLAEFGIQLIIYDFSDLRKLARFPNSDFFYFFTRYGAGSWFWKPIVILDALNKYSPQELIYLDADCVINKDPRKIISKNLESDDVVVFRQNSSLSEWISARASKKLHLDKVELQNARLITAGILILKNSTKAKDFLKIWSAAMRDPRVLLHPMISSQAENHRHDQSVLSALLFKGSIDCKVMDSGFYSNGNESLENNVANAWVYTGDLESALKVSAVRERLALLVDYHSRKLYDIVKSLVITPIHILFFLAQKNN